MFFEGVHGLGDVFCHGVEYVGGSTFKLCVFESMWGGGFAVVSKKLGRAKALRKIHIL